MEKSRRKPGPGVVLNFKGAGEACWRELSVANAILSYLLKDWAGRKVQRSAACSGSEMRLSV